MRNVFTSIYGLKMPNSHAVGTADMLGHPASIVDSRLAPRTGEGSSLLLNWVVGLTERAEGYLARMAQAEARCLRVVIESQGPFLNDAAGGGSRCAQAAASRRAQAALR